MNSNPLSQYFRQPAIYVTLPSRGRFYADGSLDMPENGELPVLPMTAIDEITYRTPDALFNGQAVVSVIQSCVPNIRNAWDMPAMDIDTVLTAIRIASFGHEMAIDTFCPKCNHESNFGLDLRTALARMTTPDYGQPLQQGDLEIHFRPMSYRDLNQNNQRQFEDQKMLQAIDQQQDADDETRMKLMSQALRKITDVAITALARSIDYIRTPQAQVTEHEHILEWLGKCDRKLFNRVRDYIIENKQKAELKPLRITCAECGNEYDQMYTLDMSSFFGDAS